MSMSNRPRFLPRPNPHHVAPPVSDYVVLIDSGAMRIKGGRRKKGDIISLSLTEAQYLELSGVVGPVTASAPAAKPVAPAAPVAAAPVSFTAPSPAPVV